MRISTTAHNASLLLAHLALQDGNKPVPAATLSDKTGISVKFIEKIIRSLKSAGMVRSVRGVAGGHILCRRPEDVTLAQVLRVIEGGVIAPTPQSEDEFFPAPVVGSWDSVAQALEDTLEKITLADLMQSEASSYSQ